MRIGFLQTVVRKQLLLCVNQAVWKRYFTVFFDLFGELDVCVLFVEVFVEFLNSVFVYCRDNIVNVT